MPNTKGLHPKYPFIHPLSFSPEEEFPKELKYFYWYFFNLYHKAIEFPIAKMPLIICQIIQGDKRF